MVDLQIKVYEIVEFPHPPPPHPLVLDVMFFRLQKPEELQIFLVLQYELLPLP